MKHISIFLLSAMIIAAGFCTNAGAQQKKAAYEGSISIGYTDPLNFGIRTTHGARYLKSNFFIGGELWLRMGFEDGYTARAGVLPRWYFVANDIIDLYIGCSIGLEASKSGSQDTWGNLINSISLGAYATPEFGIGFRLGNGDYIDIGVDFPLTYLFFLNKKENDELVHNGGYCKFDTYNVPGISIGYRF